MVRNPEGRLAPEVESVTKRASPIAAITGVPLIIVHDIVVLYAMQHSKSKTAARPTGPLCTLANDFEIILF